MEKMPSNNAVRDVINQLHQRIVTKLRGNSRTYEKTLEENRLFRLLCENPSLDAGDYAEELVKRYGYDIRGGRVFIRFRTYSMIYPDRREMLCKWAEKVADQFVLCLRSRSHNDVQKLYELRMQPPEPFFRDGTPMRFLNRVICMMIYSRYAELNIHGDAEHLEAFGDIWARYFLDEALDILDSFCVEEATAPVSETDAAKFALEQEKRKVQQLSAALERANVAMQDLETEFEERLEEEKTNNLTEFFSRLNSEKYGCILDELLNVRKGISDLQKQSFDWPIQISGLRIVIVKLTQFVRDSHIDPIMKVGSVRTVTADDVAGCDYEGTPFKDENEKKTVRVISSGWIYVDKEIQIARPKLKEVTEND